MGGINRGPDAVAGAGSNTVTSAPSTSKGGLGYFGTNTAMMVGSGGTVAANANPGNQTLTTALDAVYGPSNNSCPGIWIFLPTGALGAGQTGGAFYWHTMSSTTVGTVANLAYVPVGGAAPSATATVVNSLDAPTAAQVTAAGNATGSGSAWAAPTTAVAGPVYGLAGGNVGPSGSMNLEGLTQTANNSAGAKTVRFVFSTAVTLASPVIAAVQSMTTALSAFLSDAFAMWCGQNANATGAQGTTGVTTCMKFVTVGSVPSFNTLDESVTLYAGITLQVAVATDWTIIQGHAITVFQQ